MSINASLFSLISTSQLFCDKNIPLYFSSSELTSFLSKTFQLIFVFRCKIFCRFIICRIVTRTEREKGRTTFSNSKFKKKNKKRRYSTVCNHSESSDNQHIISITISNSVKKKKKTRDGYYPIRYYIKLNKWKRMRILSIRVLLI